MTFIEAYDPAMGITEQEEADAYFARLIDRCIEEGDSRPREEIEVITRQNLGYYAGYYSNKTRERVERLFNCEHPIFGKIAVHGPPTAKEAVELGQAMASRSWRNPPSPALAVLKRFVTLAELRARK